MKEDQRYILYEVISTDHVHSGFATNFLEQVKSRLGLFDAASAGIVPVIFDAEKKQGIVRTNAKLLDKVKIAMILDTTTIRIAKTSGTLKGLKGG